MPEGPLLFTDWLKLVGLVSAFTQIGAVAGALNVWALCIVVWGLSGMWGAELVAGMCALGGVVGGIGGIISAAAFIESLDDE